MFITNKSTIAILDSNWSTLNMEADRLGAFCWTNNKRFLKAEEMGIEQKDSPIFLGLPSVKGKVSQAFAFSNNLSEEQMKWFSKNITIRGNLVITTEKDSSLDRKIRKAINLSQRYVESINSKEILKEEKKSFEKELKALKKELKEEIDEAKSKWEKKKKKLQKLLEEGDIDEDDFNVMIKKTANAFRDAKIRRDKEVEEKERAWRKRRAELKDRQDSIASLIYELGFSNSTKFLSILTEFQLLEVFEEPKNVIPSVVLEEKRSFNTYVLQKNILSTFSSLSNQFTQFLERMNSVNGVDDYGVQETGCKYFQVHNEDWIKHLAQKHSVNGEVFDLWESEKEIEKEIPLMPFSHAHLVAALHSGYLDTEIETPDGTLLVKGSTVKEKVQLNNVEVEKYSSIIYTYNLLSYKLEKQQ